MSDLGGESTPLRPRQGSRVSCGSTAATGRVGEGVRLAHRGYGIPNAVDTQFAIASGAKGLTALAVVSLIEDGVLELSTTARSVLGGDLPLIDDGVTVEQLLAHRSGIGDYFDEEAGHEITDYVMPVPVHELATTEEYLAVLDGHATQVRTRRAVRVLQRRLRRARADRRARERRALPRAGRGSACAARRGCGHGVPALRRAPGAGPRSATSRPTARGGRNVFHLPVRGSGDGGIYSTAADISAFWRAFFAGRIVSADWVARDGAAAQRRARALEALRPRLLAPPVERHRRCWRDTTRACRSKPCTTRAHASRYTVISNTSDGAWPIARYLENATSS